MESQARISPNENEASEFPILLVCGQTSTRLTIDRYLKVHQHAVHCASTGAKGLDLDQQNVSQLIVADTALPDMSVSDFLENIRENRRLIRDVLDVGSAPVLLLTGAHEQFDDSTLKRIGVVARLQKPLKMSLLGACVDRILSGDLRVEEEQRLNLCILDPEERACSYFCKLLQADDVNVHPLTDVFDLSSMLTNKRVDVLVIELMAAAAEPVAYMREIIERSPKTQVVVCTALHDKSVHRELIDLGLRHIITKPVSPVTLRQAVRQALSEFHA